MNEAPYLLRGVADRVLANSQTASVTLAELARQGYDVPTLLMMIESYGKVSPEERTLDISQTGDAILFQRRVEKPENVNNLRLPRLGATSAAKAPDDIPPPAAVISAPPPLEEILRRTLTTKNAPPVPSPKKR